MGEVTNEPSMEEILSSIKRIIADDGEASSSAARMRAMTRRRRPEPEVEDDASEEVLELTDAVAEEQEAAPMPEAAAEDSEIVSQDVLAASRQRIQSLSAMVVRPEAGPETLEGLVREMLRPMLKDWLDANLPDLVERVVAREISRISGKTL